jgi:hypothetical protein
MTALLLLAMIGQTCPPGTACPNPAAMTLTTTTPGLAPGWQWYQLQINGRTVVVPGYQSGGVVYYDATRVPPAPKLEPTPTPTPDPTPKPTPDPADDDAGDAIGDAVRPLNYGLDMDAIASELSSEKNVIQTNDPALGQLLASEDPGRIFRPQVKVDVPDLTRPILIGVAGIIAAILFTRRPRS